MNRANYGINAIVLELNKENIFIDIPFLIPNTSLPNNYSE